MNKSVVSLMAFNSSLDRQGRNAYLRALGIQQWHLRDDEDEVHDQTQVMVMDKAALIQTKPLEERPQEIEQQNVIAPTADFAVDAEKISTMDLAELQTYVSACQVCELHKTRKQTVFGTGHHKADWLIIGEAPGADEDRQGEPFVGRAGQLLTQMLRAIGLAREEVFIANIVKCRPPNNRDPKLEEVAACQAFLHRQVELLEPKIILALGRIAAQSLLSSDAPIGKMRGKLYHLEKNNIPLVVTYHPAYLLRSPKEKRKVWEDLKFARQQVLS